MKKHLLYYTLLTAGAILITPSCIDEKYYPEDVEGTQVVEKDEENPNDNDGEDPISTWNGFSFNLRNKITLTIQVTGTDATSLATVPFLVFGEPPFTSSGVRISNVLPIGGGYTDEEGFLTTDIYAFAEVKQLYILPVNGRFGNIQTVPTMTQAVTFTETNETDPALILDERIGEHHHGTLAFEDLWPWNSADFDFNDVVINYSYSLYKNTQNLVTGIDLHFFPLASGTGFKDGFGIELPGSADNIDSIEGTEQEAGSNNLVFIIIENVGGEFIFTETGNPSKSTFANVYSGLSFQAKHDPKIEIRFKTPVSLNLEDFNPFIYCNKDRTHEIHLPCKKPTSRGNTDYFGDQNDASIPSEGVYYISKDTIYSWALDIPSLRRNSSKWKHPEEKAELKDAYPHFSKWIDSPEENNDWYYSAYADSTYLYSPN